MNAGYGLAVRWSLTEASGDVAEQLREYVVGTSMANFMFLDGLAFKTWRMREGEWFEGTYVFVDEAAREAFETQFRKDAARSPGSRIVGASPILIEPYVVVAIAEGGGGFEAAARGEE